MIKLCIKKKMNTHQGPGLLNVDFSIDKGEFVTLFGGSGAGKTTILRILAGLTDPDEGYVEFDGEVWFDSSKAINLPVQKRRVGFVFQDYSLFPHMTIGENLFFALRDKSQEQRIDEWLEMMDLKGLRNQKAHQLSGGQKQRVALARALVNEPQMLLLDEPLSALDSELRSRLQDEIVRIHQKTNITTLLVSHDLPEVRKLSARIFVIENGQITKSGHPKTIFS